MYPRLLIGGENSKDKREIVVLGCPDAKGRFSLDVLSLK
jgi:hypothetical protein